MNRQQAKELLPIIQVFAEGKKLYRYKKILIGAILAIMLILILVHKDTASKPNLSTVHSPILTSVGRQCKSISRSDGQNPYPRNASISYQKLMIMVASSQIMTMFHSKLFLHQTRLLTEHRLA